MGKNQKKDEAIGVQKAFVGICEGLPNAFTWKNES